MNRLQIFYLTLALSAGSPVLKGSVILSEGFNDITTLAGSGWAITNNSTAGGLATYFQGNATIFSSQAGGSSSYIAANFDSAAFGGTISNWLITPQLTLNNGYVLSFYTRTETASLFPDALQVRLSTNGASVNVGATTASTGDFTNLLLSINPSLTTGGYPEAWTLQTITLSGLGGPVSGRFAFRYAVADTSVNGDYIGIDTVSVSDASTVPEPASLALLMAGGGAMVYAARRKRK